MECNDSTLALDWSCVLTLVQLYHLGFFFLLFLSFIYLFFFWFSTFRITIERNHRTFWLLYYCRLEPPLPERRTVSPQKTSRVQRLLEVKQRNQRHPRQGLGERHVNFPTSTVLTQLALERSHHCRHLYRCGRETSRQQPLAAPAEIGTRRR